MFSIGQKVVCVDASPGWTGNDRYLREGAIYTVSAVIVGSYGQISPGHWREMSGLQVAEIKMARPRDWFRVDRFRPVQERKTDISVFTAMLRKRAKVLSNNS